MSATHPLAAKQGASGFSRAHPRKRLPPSAPRSTQAAPPGAPAYLAAGCQRSGAASSPSPPGLLQGWERHVPGVHGRTLGNYYGLGARGAGGRCLGVVGGSRSKAFYSPPKPPPATEHAQLPGVAPRRTFREHTQLFRVFVAAGGRQAGAAAGGGSGEVSEEGRRSVYSQRSPGKRKPPLAHPIALSSARPGGGSFCMSPPYTLGFCRNVV